MLDASISPVVEPDDQGRAEEQPQELIPIKERKAPQARLDRVVGRHPQQNEERDREQPPPPAGQGPARGAGAAIHGRTGVTSAAIVVVAIGSPPYGLVGRSCSSGAATARAFGSFGAQRRL